MIQKSGRAGAGITMPSQNVFFRYGKEKLTVNDFQCFQQRGFLCFTQKICLSYNNFRKRVHKHSTAEKRNMFCENDRKRNGYFCLKTILPLVRS